MNLSEKYRELFELQLQEAQAAAATFKTEEGRKLATMLVRMIETFVYGETRTSPAGRHHE